MGARRSHTHTSSIAKSLRLSLALASVGSTHKPPRDRGFLLLAHSAYSHTYIRTRDSFARSLINHYPNSLLHTHSRPSLPTRGRLFTTAIGSTRESLSLNISRSRAHHCTYLSLPRGSCFRSCSAPSSTADALGSTRVVLVAVTRISAASLSQLQLTSSAMTAKVVGRGFFSALLQFLCAYATCLLYQARRRRMTGGGARSVGPALRRGATFEIVTQWAQLRLRARSGLSLLQSIRGDRGELRCFLQHRNSPTLGHYNS